MPTTRWPGSRARTAPAAADAAGAARGRRRPARGRPDRQGRRRAAVGGDAGAAARRRAFAASGKPTVAWAESFGEGVGRHGGVRAGHARSTRSGCSRAASSGCSASASRRRSCAGALDKLGIEPQLEQRYEYKNAADRIMRTEFTAAHRESLDRLAESIYDDAVADDRRRRGLSPRAVRELVDTGPRTAAEALRGRAGRPARLPRRGVRRGARAGGRREPSCCSPTAGSPRRRPPLPAAPQGPRRPGRGARRDRLRTGPARADGAPGRQRLGRRGVARGRR